MDKPGSRDGYSRDVTEDCVSVLVTLLRRLGPWRRSVYLVGGLAPRYIVKLAEGSRPPHVGTLDVDLLIDREVLDDVAAYDTLESNLKRLGFERATNRTGAKLSWRWQIRTKRGNLIALDLLSESPDVPGGRVMALPTRGTVSALNVPRSSLVFVHHEESRETSELLGEDGLAEVVVRHADIVGEVCLKALSFDDRAERKDAYDIIYCLEYTPPDETGRRFRAALEGPRGEDIATALAILRRRFRGPDPDRAHLLDGPVAVAKFELGEDDDAASRERRALRQREVAAVVARLLGPLD